MTIKRTYHGNSNAFDYPDHDKSINKISKAGTERTAKGTTIQFLRLLRGVNWCTAEGGDGS